MDTASIRNRVRELLVKHPVHAANHDSLVGFGRHLVQIVKSGDRSGGDGEGWRRHRRGFGCCRAHSASNAWRVDGGLSAHLIAYQRSSAFPSRSPNDMRPQDMHRSLAKIDCPIRGQECYNSIDMQNPILQVIKAKYTSLEPVLDERARRLWAGAEARAIGRGG